MKKTILALSFLTFGTLAARAQTPAPVQSAASATAPKFQFIGGEAHDFGGLTDAKAVEYTFAFKNVGKTPLIITNASASCGCTVPEFSKSPVLPGQSGSLKVTYNAVGKNGPFDKIIYIESNAPSNVASQRYELHIKGTVTPVAAAK